MGIYERSKESTVGRASDNKLQIMMVVCANAIGHMIPPMVIFKGKRFNLELTIGEFPSTLHRTFEQGWIDRELFYF